MAPTMQWPCVVVAVVIRTAATTITIKTIMIITSLCNPPYNWQSLDNREVK